MTTNATTDRINRTAREPEQWFSWLADQPCLIDAIDTAIEADMAHGLIASAVGKWIAENRRDELAERIHQAFVRVEKWAR